MVTKLKNRRGMMKIVLMGNHLGGINALDYLLKRGHEVLVIIPFNKKVHAWHASLHDFAINAKVENVYNPQNVNDSDCIDLIRNFSPDIILSVYYDQILSAEVLRIPRIGAFNVHPSLLPKYRGVAPLIWAIINGEQYAGITFHEMVEKVDSGRIVLQRRIRITSRDTGYTLHLKAAAKIKKLMPEFLKYLSGGNIKYTPQVGSESLYTRKAPSMNELQFSTNTALKNYNIIRALTKPLPGAYFFVHGKKVYVWKSHVITSIKKQNLKKENSIYFDLDNRRIFVECAGNTYLSLDEIDIDESAGGGGESAFSVLSRSIEPSSETRFVQK
jgi:methionyl-tRNA formyltransferase